MSLQDLIQFVDILGVFVFAISGALVAIQKRMDILGMLVLAVVTAVGGGTLRSILIGDTPVPFLQNPSYLIACIGATLIVFYFHRLLKKLDRPIIIFDAVGLGLFMGLGMTIALERGLPIWASLLLGIITASFGGVIRDILSAEIPLIFRKEFYASACLIGGLFYLALSHYQVNHEVLIVASTLTVFIVRMLGIHYNWSLPHAKNS
jgi:uncharacterized membrane protein YeiH